MVVCVFRVDNRGGTFSWFLVHMPSFETRHNELVLTSVCTSIISDGPIHTSGPGSDVLDTTPGKRRAACKSHRRSPCVRQAAAGTLNFGNRRTPQHLSRRCRASTLSIREQHNSQHQHQQLQQQKHRRSSCSSRKKRLAGLPKNTDRPPPERPKTTSEKHIAPARSPR